MKKNILKFLLIITLIIGASASAVFASNTTTKGNKIANNTTNTENVASNVVENENVSESSSVAQQATVPQTTNTTNEGENKSNGLGLIAVALATGLACIGAGIAVATVGASAVGAISENPKLLGKTIIFAGLAEGIAIYGLIISIMILNKI